MQRRAAGLPPRRLKATSSSRHADARNRRQLRARLVAVEATRSSRWGARRVRAGLPGSRRHRSSEFTEMTKGVERRDGTAMSAPPRRRGIRHAGGGTETREPGDLRAAAPASRGPNRSELSSSSMRRVHLGQLGDHVSTPAVTVSRRRVHRSCVPVGTTPAHAVSSLWRRRVHRGTASWEVDPSLLVSRRRPGDEFIRPRPAALRRLLDLSRRRSGDEFIEGGRRRPSSWSCCVSRFAWILTWHVRHVDGLSRRRQSVEFIEAAETKRCERMVRKSRRHRGDEFIEVAQRDRRQTPVRRSLRRLATSASRQRLSRRKSEQAGVSSPSSDEFMEGVQYQITSRWPWYAAAGNDCASPDM